MTIKVLHPEKSADSTLQDAVGAYDTVITIGFNHGGYIETRCTDNWDVTQIIYALEQVKLLFLMENHYDDD